MQVPEAHITDVHVQPDIASGLVTVSVRGTPAASGAPYRAVVSANANAVAAACGSVGQPLPLTINGAQLWSPAHPFLYDIDVALLDDDALQRGVCEPEQQQQQQQPSGWRSWLTGSAQLQAASAERDARASQRVQRENTTRLDAYADDAGPRLQLAATSGSHAPRLAQERAGAAREGPATSRRRLLSQSQAAGASWMHHVLSRACDLTASVPSVQPAACQGGEVVEVPDAWEEAAAMDHVRSYFGIREVSIGPVGPGGHPRPLLNGEFIFQIGMLDQVTVRSCVMEKSMPC